jgi:putative transposase
MKKYWHGAHTTHRQMYHIVWLPKYRKKILVGRVKERVEEVLRACAEMNDWEIQELNVNVDHVHMAIQLPPSISTAKAVQFLKGTSSRAVREELPEVRKYLWGKDFWADGYFSETFGDCSMETILNYIRNQ